MNDRLESSAGGATVSAASVTAGTPADEAAAPRPTRAPRANRKQEILECFAVMVSERGYDEVSLRDVAEQLGMSKGTILHHFGSKDRVLERLHADYMGRRLAEARAFLSRLSSPSSRLAGIVYQLMMAQRDDYHATVAFARELVRFASEPNMRHVRSLRHEYSELVTDIVREGVRDGTFSTDEPEIVTLQLFGMCNWSWTWFRPDGRWSAEEIASVFVATLLEGLRTGRPAPTSRQSDDLSAVPSIVGSTMAELSQSELPLR